MDDEENYFLHGNCYMPIIAEMLYSCKEFKEKYFIYPITHVYRMTSDFDFSVLEYMDIWIHQDIRTNNDIGYWVSDENMRRHFRNNVI